MKDAYEVKQGLEKPKKKTLLPKGWKNKKALRQVFVLHEILKRPHAG